MKKLSILTVDDDKIQSTIINKVLSKYCDSVVSMENGYEALDYLKSNPIDLIITDLDMPIISGINLIREIRSINYKIPIVVITSHTTSDYFLPAVNSNIQAYIEKPITDEKILTLINNLYKYFENIINEESNNLNTDLQYLEKNIFYDNKNLEIINNDTIHTLNNKERLLLQLLIENKNRLVSYRNIDIIVWQKEDGVMTNDALKNVIKSLRNKISKDSIKNISGLGYKLIIKNY